MGSRGARGWITLVRFRLCLRMLGGDQWVGGAYYIQNLVRCLSSLPPSERGRLHITLESKHQLVDYVNPIRRMVDRVRYTGFLRSAAEFGARTLNQRARVSRLLTPYHLVYPGSKSGRSWSPSAAWIPDFQHRHLSHFFSQSEIEARERRNLDLAINSDFVVLSSEMARADFVSLYPFASKKARILRFVSVMDPDWVRGDPSPTVAAYGLPKRFLLVSNKFWAHKNHELVLRALKVASQKESSPFVVCTGSTIDERNKDHFESVQRKMKEWGIAGQIRISGQIPGVTRFNCCAVLWRWCNLRGSRDGTRPLRTRVHWARRY